MYGKILWYNMHRKHILRRIQTKDTLRVAFFVVNLSMWKSDSLFRLMMTDSRFDPVIVPMPRPQFNADSEKEEQLRMIEFCKENGYPYIPGYDYEKGQFNGFDQIKPDLVFYSQPYNAAFPAHKIESFWHNCLFFYVPYCFIIEKTSVLLNTLYMNICQKVFLESQVIRDMESHSVANKGKNFMVSGYLDSERLRGLRDGDYDIWKGGNKDVKRIIWAPHHSILKKDILNYSTFLDIADDMLQIAREYEGKVLFAFKPHPGLKPKLYDLEGWGKERTDKYYSEWENMPGTILSEGKYDSLFRSSDAMIHDCSSFSVEYLYTGKPVMYIAKQDHMDFMNEFGARCYDMHYKGETVAHIRKFIDDVVLNGNDDMKDCRNKFINDNLEIDNEKTAAGKIIDYLAGLIKS